MGPEEKGRMVIYALCMLLALNGLVLIGIRNNRQQQERLYKDALRQLRVTAISRGFRR